MRRIDKLFWFSLSLNVYFLAYIFASIIAKTINTKNIQNIQWHRFFWIFLMIFFQLTTKIQLTYLSSLFGDSVGWTCRSIDVGRKTIIIDPNMLQAVSNVINQWRPRLFWEHWKFTESINPIKFISCTHQFRQKRSENLRENKFNYGFTGDQFQLTSAIPAATLQAPTPMLRIDVGYNSAV